MEFLMDLTTICPPLLGNGELVRTRDEVANEEIILKTRLEQLGRMKELLEEEMNRRGIER